MNDPPVAVPHEDTDAAFRALYAEHGPALLRLTTTLTSGDRGRAEDLVQETMLRAWTHRDNLDIEHRSPQAWLITVARHLAVDAHRARHSRPPEGKLDENLAFADSHPIHARVDEVGLRAAIATLPGPQRRALTEVYYRDRSPAETARILRIPPAQSDHASSTGCAHCVVPSQLTMRRPSPPRRRRRPGNRSTWVPGTPQPRGRADGEAKGDLTMDANPRIMGDSAGMRSHGWAQEPRMRRRTTAPPDWESPLQPSDRALRAEVALKALCADGTLHPDEWFPVSITVKAARREAARAIAICTACPVRGACLELALRHWTIGQHGVWGGLVPAERAALRRQRLAGAPGYDFALFMARRGRPAASSGIEQGTRGAG